MSQYHIDLDQYTIDKVVNLLRDIGKLKNNLQYLDWDNVAQIVQALPGIAAKAENLSERLNILEDKLHTLTLLEEDMEKIKSSAIWGKLFG